MQYQTIILELLQQRPALHEQLKEKRTMLQTMERYANQLKTSHAAWKEQLSQARPNSDPSQIGSEALEIALQEMADYLDSQLLSDQNEPLSLDGAMAFIRRHTPPA